MALGDDYITTSALKGELGDGIPDADDDTQLALAIATATEWINDHCGRDFNDAGSATARVYYPRDCGLLVTDDFQTVTTLKTDTSDDGTFNQTWTTADYQLEPLNGIVGGTTGFPYYRLRAVETLTFPVAGKRASVELTAQWGWAAVPSRVKKACTIQAARLFKRKDSPEGVLGGFSEFGAVRVGTRLDPDVAMSLESLRRSEEAVPIA